MAFFQVNAPRRDTLTGAKIKHIIQRAYDMLRKFGRLGSTRDPHISDHLARDIGLTTSQIELRRLQLPSQTAHHPRG